MVLHREQLGDVRTVIGLMECWAAEGEPTPTARLAYARSLIDLRLMDRAWVALRELADVRELAIETHRQTARMFLLRGWPKRARTALQKALAEAPNDPELNALWEASGQAPPQLGGAAPEDPTEALTRAELHMGRGEVLRAQALLEGVLRDEPDSARAADLLWALEGDFSLDGTLAEAVERLAPSVGELADLHEDPEFTESLTTQGDDETAEDNASDPRFPHLFREPADPITEDYDEAETTQARLMASQRDMFADEEHTPLQEDESAAGDTQILRVIEQGRVTPASGKAHQEVVLPDEHFDLDAYRREMGVLDAAPVPLGSDLEPLETEDNDVIVFTRLENQDLSPGLEPDPSEDTMSHPDASRFLSEAAREAADKEFDARARAIAASAVADEVTAKLKPSSVSAPERPSRTRREPDFLTRHTGALLAIILALLCAILILVFAIAFRFWQS